MAVLAVAGCQDREPTGPEGMLRPQFTHETLHQEPGFYFIAPTPPGNTPVPGEFDPALTPSVEIWQLAGQNGDVVGTEPVAALTAVVDVAQEQYQVSWTGLHGLPRGYYRIEVRSAPSNRTHLFYGSVEVQLVSGGGSGLDVGGNTLPIKFWISTSARCPDDSVCATVYNDASQVIVVVPGAAALLFEKEFCAKLSPSGDCLEFITVTASRYRGPERCIPDPGFRTTGGHPVPVPTIQYELCIRVTTNPANVTFDEQTVFAYMCADQRAEPLRNRIQVLSVKENGGSAIGQPVTNLTPTVTTSPQTGILDSCGPPHFDDLAAGDAAATGGRLARFASLAQRALVRAGRLLAPAPAHARRRANIPIVSSPIGFSRLGLVVPVAAQFTNDGGTGSPGGQPNPQPQVRVLAVNPDGTFPAGDVGVPEAEVRFTVTGGGGSVSPAIVLTNNTGFASPTWTLGSPGVQTLRAEVGSPARLTDVPTTVDDVTNRFPNNDHNQSCTAGTAGCYWWDSHEFTALSRYEVVFLSPLGESGSGLTNLGTGISPRVFVCGPLATPEAECTSPRELPAPTLKNNAWETAWKTDRNTVDNSLYRIEVRVGCALTGNCPPSFTNESFLVRRGGGGGSDPEGTYQFQTGSNLPVKFIVVAP